MTVKVSVVMSAYNSAEYLGQAIESILQQTFAGFEFIIIDDGSTDRTWNILSGYAEQDQRIRLFKNARNIGLTKSLNRGIMQAKGTYIARQDADDISLPERLQTQVAYMESHPSTALLAAGVQYIDEKGNQLWRDIPPQNDTLLLWNLLFRNPLRHSTVCWRRQLIEERIGRYSPEFMYAQDYELWERIAEKLPIAVFPEVLVKMRWHADALSVKQMEAQDAFAIQVTRRQLQSYLPGEYLSDQEIANFRVMPRQKDILQTRRFYALTSCQFKAAAFRYLRVWQQFRKTPFFSGILPDRHVLQDDIEQDILLWLKYCKHQHWYLIGGILMGAYWGNCPHRVYPLIYTVIRQSLLSGLNVFRPSVEKAEM